MQHFGLVAQLAVGIERHLDLAAGPLFHQFLEFEAQLPGIRRDGVADADLEADGFHGLRRAGQQQAQGEQTTEKKRTTHTVLLGIEGLHGQDRAHFL